MALTAAKDAQGKLVPWATRHGFLAASSVSFFAGGLVVIDQADGLLKKASTALNLIAVGRCNETFTTGASNTRKVEAFSGIFPFKNSTSADLIATDDIGKTCFIVDDEQVALTNGSSTRSAAGTVYDVDPDGTVWVAVKFPL